MFKPELDYFGGVCHRLALSEGQKENNREKRGTYMKESEKKEGKTKIPLGVIAVAVIDFISGFAGIVLGIFGFFLQPFWSLYAFVISFMLLVSGLGLLELKRWAWYLTVGVSVISLALYPWLPVEGFPLEILVLPYLVWKRRIFGVKLSGM